MSLRIPSLRPAEKRSEFPKRAATHRMANSPLEPQRPATQHRATASEILCVCEHAFSPTPYSTELLGFAGAADGLAGFGFSNVTDRTMPAPSFTTIIWFGFMSFNVSKIGR